jgi:hypothetical protein
MLHQSLLATSIYCENDCVIFITSISYFMFCFIWCMSLMGAFLFIEQGNGSARRNTTTWSKTPN